MMSLSLITAKKVYSYKWAEEHLSNLVWRNFYKKSGKMWCFVPKLFFFSFLGWDKSGKSKPHPRDSIYRVKDQMQPFYRWENQPSGAVTSVLILVCTVCFTVDLSVQPSLAKQKWQEQLLFFPFDFCTTHRQQDLRRKQDKITAKEKRRGEGVKNKFLCYVQYF